MAALTAQEQVLREIDVMLAQEEESIAIPLTKINQGIASLAQTNAKLVTRLEGKVIRDLDRHLVAQDNHVDAVSTVVLTGLQNWQDQLRLLLTQLAAKTGLTDPGDELEAALLSQVSEAPELAYSATLLLAIRDLLPYADKLIIVLREIRDRMPNLPEHVPGEPQSGTPTYELPELPNDVPGEPIKRPG